MLRVACTGDSHLSERLRLDDNVAVHLALVDQARDAGVDLFLHGGDLYDRRSTPTERNAAVEILTAMTEVAPVFLVRGNHDVEGDIDILARLRTKHRLIVETRATAAPGSAHELDLAGTIVGLLGLSWFSKAHLCASLPSDTTVASTTNLTIEAARSLLVAIRAEAHRVAAAGGIPILAAHALVAGSETSTGQVLVGQGVEFSPGDLIDLGCAWVNLSHIHKGQGWDRLRYPGSPQRHDLGELESKGWVYVEIDPERWREPGGVRWEFRELPARRILLIERDWTESVGAGDQWNRSECAGALVRFRYRIRAESLHAVDEADIERGLLNAGAHEVKIEAVLVHATRVRCAEISAARDTWERVEAWLAAKQIATDEPMRERLRAKLAEIEQGQEVPA